MDGGPDTGLSTRVKLGMTVQHRLDTHLNVFWAYGSLGTDCRTGDLTTFTPDQEAANKRAVKSGDSGRIQRLLMKSWGKRVGEESSVQPCDCR